MMQKLYENRLVMKLSQSTQRIVILCRGEGLEPRIEFDRPLMEFGPVLPHTAADEKDITIRNPCKFPLEIYNLEFDKVYLEEEKVSLLYITSSCLVQKVVFFKQFYALANNSGP